MDESRYTRLSDIAIYNSNPTLYLTGVTTVSTIQNLFTIDSNFGYILIALLIISIYNIYLMLSDIGKH